MYQTFLVGGYLHRRNNAIDTLLVDGVTLSNLIEVGVYIVNYFENLLLEQFSW